MIYNSRAVHPVLFFFVFFFNNTIVFFPYRGNLMEKDEKHSFKKDNRPFGNSLL